MNDDVGERHHGAPIALRFVPRLWAALGYPLLLAISLLLFFGRSYPSLRSQMLTGILPDLYAHVSNFSLAVVVYTTMGYVGLMQGLTEKHVLMIGAGIALANVLFEQFIPWLNVRDGVDGVYGIAGVCVGLLFLFATKKWGLECTHPSLG